METIICWLRCSVASMSCCAIKKINKDNLSHCGLCYTLYIITVLKSQLAKYQPSGEGGTRSPPAKSKLAARGPKMVDGVWKGVYPYVFGHSKQLSLNKFFDPSTPSMRKVDDGEEK